MGNKHQKDMPVSAQAKQQNENSLCVNSLRVFSPAQKKDGKQRWIDQHDLWIATVDKADRVFTPVVLSGLLVWMDAATGSVYMGDGRCLTSDVLNIKISSVLKNQVKAGGMLMALSVKEMQDA